MDLMYKDFRFREVREIAEAADYDLERIKKSYDYMTNYGSEVEVPIAFMKDCIKNEYYNSTSTPKKPTRNAFNDFEKRPMQDFDELEKFLIENE